MESIEFQSQQLRLTSPSFSGPIVPCSKWPHYQPTPNIIVAIIYPSTFPYSICVYIRTYIYDICISEYTYYSVYIYTVYNHKYIHNNHIHNYTSIITNQIPMILPFANQTASSSAAPAIPPEVVVAINATRPSAGNVLNPWIMWI